MPTATTTVPLRMRVQRHGAVLDLRATGEIDANTGPGLTATLLATLDGSDRVVHLDLTDVHLVDTAGLDAIEQCRLAAEERDTAFAVVHPSSTVRRVLALAKRPGLVDESA